MSPPPQAGGTTPSAGPHDPAGDLVRSAASGVKWGLFGSIGQQAMRLLFLFVLARLLGPANFGIVAQATIYISFTQFFLDQGFGSALIQKRDLDARDIGSVVWLNAASIVVVSVATWFLAPSIASFFDTPELAWVLRVLIFTVVLKGLSVVPRSLVNRRLGFRALGITEIASVVVGGAGGIAAALAGADYWALVVQTVLTDAVFMLGVRRSAGPLGRHGSWSRLRAMMSYSSGVMGSGMVRYFSQNADNILVGRFLGATPLALYALSYRVLTLPIHTLGRIMNQVAFPVFSRLHGQPARVRNWFFMATKGAALVAYPGLTLIVLAAPHAVPLVFGARWAPAVPTMQILAIAAFRNIVMMLIGPLFLSHGRTRLHFFWTVTTSVLLMASFAAGLPWGIVGVATGYAVVSFALAPFNIVSAGRLIDFTLGEYLRCLLGPVTGCVAMAALWFGAGAFLEGLGLHVVADLSVRTLLALAGYAGTIRLGFPSSVDAARQLRQAMSSQGRSARPSAGEDMLAPS